MSGQHVYLVFLLEDGEYDNAFVFSTLEKAEKWASSQDRHYLVTTRTVDYPETITEVRQ